MTAVTCPNCGCWIPMDRDLCMFSVSRGPHPTEMTVSQGGRVFHRCPMRNVPRPPRSSARPPKTRRVGASRTLRAIRMSMTGSRT